jgi:hypothetical protein
MLLVPDMRRQWKTPSAASQKEIFFFGKILQPSGIEPVIVGSQKRVKYSEQITCTLIAVKDVTC